MTPEELLQRIVELEREMQLLRAGSTIPFDIEKALRERLRIGTFNPTTLSAKGATTENQSVNESGVATYSVLKPPDAFLTITIGSTAYNIPVYT